MAWTTTAQVRQRVKEATDANGWTSTEIGEQMTRAEDELKSILIPRYGSEQVALWDTAETCPSIIDDIAADLTAAYIYLCAYGQDIHNPGTAGGALRQNADRVIDKILSHQAELLLSDGTVIKQVDTGLSRVDSTTREYQGGGLREPYYTIGERATDPGEPGSLDHY